MRRLIFAPMLMLVLVGLFPQLAHARVIYWEDFEGPDAPEGWTVVDNSGGTSDARWEFGDGYGIRIGMSDELREDFADELSPFEYAVFFLGYGYVRPDVYERPDDVFLVNDILAGRHTGTPRTSLRSPQFACENCSSLTMRSTITAASAYVSLDDTCYDVCIPFLSREGNHQAAISVTIDDDIVQTKELLSLQSSPHDFAQVLDMSLEPSIGPNDPFRLDWTFDGEAEADATGLMMLHDVCLSSPCATQIQVKEHDDSGVDPPVNLDSGVYCPPIPDAQVYWSRVDVVIDSKRPLDSSYRVLAAFRADTLGAPDWYSGEVIPIYPDGYSYEAREPEKIPVWAFGEFETGADPHSSRDKDEEIHPAVLSYSLCDAAFAGPADPDERWCFIPMYDGLLMDPDSSAANSYYWGGGSFEKEYFVPSDHPYLITAVFDTACEDPGLTLDGVPVPLPGVTTTTTVPPTTTTTSTTTSTSTTASSTTTLAPTTTSTTILPTTSTTVVSTTTTTTVPSEANDDDSSDDDAGDDDTDDRDPRDADDVDDDRDSDDGDGGGCGI
ncbi:MAG: hypothetical protein H6684_03845 [Deltaproteobacteria bacterium]|nr:hypothetical protein [Deltaproteobacteria bacterium]